jgi:DNA-binding IclR family transcriptional regulator
MSQSVGLTPPQRRVLERLEQLSPSWRNAAELAADLGLDVRLALASVQELVRLGYVRRGPKFAGETDATELYAAATKPSSPHGRRRRRAAPGVSAVRRGPGRRRPAG